MNPAEPLPLEKSEKMPKEYSANMNIVWLAEGVFVTEKNAVSIGDLYSDISKIFDLSKSAIKSHDRRRGIVTPRHIFCYVARKLTGYSLLSIGEYINRDHTTIMHSVTEVKNKLCIDDDDLMAYWNIFKERSTFYTPTLEVGSGDVSPITLFKKLQRQRDMPGFRDMICTFFAIRNSDFVYGSSMACTHARWMFINLAHRELISNADIDKFLKRDEFAYKILARWQENDFPTAFMKRWRNFLNFSALKIKRKP